MADLKIIYYSYIRSVLEQSCVVWHSSLTEEDSDNLERVQKNALRVILDYKYVNYESALQILKIKTLKERREQLCGKFAKKCTISNKFKDLFTENVKEHEMKTRKKEKYSVSMANTERYKKSAIPFMQRLLNKINKENPNKVSHTERKHG